MIGTLLRCAAVALLPLALSACVVPDLSRAEGAWAPQGTNTANLAAMVENPADLSHGRGDTGPDRKISAKAVTDLWANPHAPLEPDAGSAGGAQSGGGQGSSSGSGGSGGGGGGSNSSGGSGGGLGGASSSAGSGS